MPKILFIIIYFYSYFYSNARNMWKWEAVRKMVIQMKRHLASLKSVCLFFCFCSDVHFSNSIVVFKLHFGHHNVVLKISTAVF